MPFESVSHWNASGRRPHGVLAPRQSAGRDGARQASIPHRFGPEQVSKSPTVLPEIPESPYINGYSFFCHKLIIPSPLATRQACIHSYSCAQSRNTL
ncbi:uncharacterized protein STAUR_2904 [Stigmatella aurantiaca DW4/3-1]|uniref:Uncharacterized protein n=1 Tax=Stigmatella aurantiaca (strain DW4/3-1) TaxID=378806 RepID=E3FQK3_STIAD|nr:uncharacterized protein STAUR_2904 [Stigmatella aurantiaca DW4/3-1]